LLFSPLPCCSYLDGMVNATAILKQLDEREIRERIDDIDRERDALMVLLRAARRNSKKPVKKEAEAPR
jgi:hypothetical protein